MINFSSITKWADRVTTTFNSIDIAVTLSVHDTQPL